MTLFVFNFGVNQDAREVVEDSIYDQLGTLEHTYLLAPRAPQGESLNKRGSF